jgi:hypothetical protein
MAGNGDLPFPLKHDVKDGDVVLRSTERAAIADLAAVLQLCASGRLRCSEKTRRPTAATVKAVQEVLSAGDFYDDEAIASFAWPLLLLAGGLAETAGAKMTLTDRGTKALRKPGAETIAQLWRRWITGGVIDEFSRIESIKGQRKTRAVTAVKPRRTVVAQALAECCPPGEWVTIEELFAAMRHAGHDPEVSRGTNVWKLYIGDPEYGSLGYDGHGDWTVLQGRYTLAVLFEYACTLGLFDVGYVRPDGAPPNELPDYMDHHYEALSRYDGLLAVRLTPLGSYAMGLTASYEPGPAPADGSGGIELKVLNNMDIVVAGTLLPADTMRLDTFAERTSDRVWTLTMARGLAAIDAGRDLGELTAFLKRGADHELPNTVTEFLTDLAGRTSRLSNAGLVRLIECTDPALAVMISRDRRTARFCRPVGDRHLAVPVEHEADFRKAVRTLGYVLPPGR